MYVFLFLFEECMAGDVNLFFDDCQQDTAEIEIMIAGININLEKLIVLNSELPVHCIKANVLTH